MCGKKDAFSATMAPSVAVTAWCSVCEEIIRRMPHTPGRAQHRIVAFRAAGGEKYLRRQRTCERGYGAARLFDRYPGVVTCRMLGRRGFRKYRTSPGPFSISPRDKAASWRCYRDKPCAYAGVPYCCPSFFEFGVGANFIYLICLLQEFYFFICFKPGVSYLCTSLGGMCVRP